MHFQLSNHELTECDEHLLRRNLQSCSVRSCVLVGEVFRNKIFRIHTCRVDEPLIPSVWPSRFAAYKTAQQAFGPENVIVLGQSGNPFVLCMLEVQQSISWYVKRWSDLFHEGQTRQHADTAKPTKHILRTYCSVPYKQSSDGHRLQESHTPTQLRRSSRPSM